VTHPSNPVNRSGGAQRLQQWIPTCAAMTAMHRASDLIPYFSLYADKRKPEGKAC
jgi:hypothetical protein